MDLASPAVSGTSVYANGLSSYADIITAVFKTVYLPMYIDNCTFNTAGMNKLKKIKNKKITSIYIYKTHIYRTSLRHMSQESVYSTTIQCVTSQQAVYISTIKHGVTTRKAMSISTRLQGIESYKTACVY